MNKPTYKIEIGWECTDWASDYDFSGTYDDVTNYVVMPIRIARNRKPEDWLFPAATLELKLRNDSKIFYPTNSLGVLYEKIRPMLPIRITGTHIETDYPLYYGYLSNLVCYPVKDKKHVYLYAKDGIDILAKAIVIQDMDDLTTMTDGDAVELLIDCAGWSATRRTIDKTGGDIISMPDTFNYEKGA